MNKTEEQAEKLIAFSEAKEHRAWPHIAQLCKLDADWSRIPVQTVCAAFATHAENRN
jgi:hypothetical protein